MRPQNPAETSAVIGFASGNGSAEQRGVEMPLHHRRVELHRAAQDLGIAPSGSRSRIRQLQQSCFEGSLQDAAGQRLDRAEPELGRERQHRTEVDDVLALEDRDVAFDPKGLLDHRTGKPDMLDAEGDRLAEGRAAEQRVAEDAEIRNTLALAGEQADRRLGREPQHVGRRARSSAGATCLASGLGDRLGGDASAFEQQSRAATPCSAIDVDQRSEAEHAVHRQRPCSLAVVADDVAALLAGWRRLL